MTETQKPNVDILESVLTRLEGIKSYAEAYRRRYPKLSQLDHLERMDKVLEGIADHEGWNIPAIATD